jgi:hypothetical protein
MRASTNLGIVDNPINYTPRYFGSDPGGGIDSFYLAPGSGLRGVEGKPENVPNLVYLGQVIDLGNLMYVGQKYRRRNILRVSFADRADGYGE